MSPGCRKTALLLTSWESLLTSWCVHGMLPPLDTELCKGSERIDSEWSMEDSGKAVKSRGKAVKRQWKVEERQRNGSERLRKGRAAPDEGRGATLRVQ